MGQDSEQMLGTGMEENKMLTSPYLAAAFLGVRRK